MVLFGQKEHYIKTGATSLTILDLHGNSVDYFWSAAFCENRINLQIVCSYTKFRMQAYLGIDYMGVKSHTLEVSLLSYMRLYRLVTAQPTSQVCWEIKILPKLLWNVRPNCEKKKRNAITNDSSIKLWNALETFQELISDSCLLSNRKENSVVWIQKNNNELEARRLI